MIQEAWVVILAMPLSSLPLARKCLWASLSSSLKREYYLLQPILQIL